MVSSKPVAVKKTDSGKGIDFTTTISVLLIVVTLTAATVGRDIPRVIIIDPGHGGTAKAGSDQDKNLSTPNNATSVTRGIKEKDLALSLAKMTAERIQMSDAGRNGRVKVILTRTSDINLNFTQRTKVAVAANASCYVAIHFNSDDSHRISGPRAVIQQRSANPNYEVDKKFGEGLAKAVEMASKRFRAATPNASLHDDHELHQGRGSYLFYQMNASEKTRLIPTCHLEVEFLDNATIENQFFVRQKQELLSAWADAISQELIEQMLTSQTNSK